MRQRLFLMYVGLAAIPVGLYVIGRLTAFAHDVAVPAAITSIRDSLVNGLQAVVEHPTTIPALIFVISLIWCFPWEILRFEDDDPSQQRRVDRGRQVLDYDQALHQSRAGRGRRRKTRRPDRR